jgi:hypothetical protein
VKPVLTENLELNTNIKITNEKVCFLHRGNLLGILGDNISVRLLLNPAEMGIVLFAFY